MVQLDIDSLLSLTGDLKDGEESQGKFRNFLSKEDLTLQDLESWINDCLESTGSNYNRALQDIINAIGERLGFSVDYGFYQGRQGEIGYDGVWAYPDENVKLVIETKKTTAYEIDTNQVVDYIQELEAATDTEENVYGLFVIGKENINTVVNTIRGSPHRGSLRIVPVPKLLTLLDLKQKASLRDEKIVKLLLPLNTINIGEIIQLIDDIVETRVREGQIESPPEVANGPSEFPVLSRDELQELEDGTVVVCPSKPKGVNFLSKYQAWGFVNIAEEPNYFALYVSAPQSSIKYFAKVKEIVDPRSSASPVADNLDDFRSYEPGKQLILFEQDSLYKLEEEIPLGDNRRMAPQGLRYFQFSNLRKAKTLDDLA